MIVPGAPDMVIGKALNDKSISLSWKEPQQPNGIIVGYQILYYSYKEDKDEGTEMVPPGCYTYKAINLAMYICSNNRLSKSALS